jgi:hypothetical protein
MSKRIVSIVVLVLIAMIAGRVSAQSFRVQCPSSTITHPATNNDSDPAYTSPTYTGNQTYLSNGAGNANGAIKCQQISGGDGYATMGDGTQTYMFSFGPLSGLASITAGQPGTEPPSTFNSPYGGSAPLVPGDPATTVDNGGAFDWDGAVGLIGNPDTSIPNGGQQATAVATIANGIIEDVTITNGGTKYNGPATVTFSAPPCSPGPACETALGNVVLTNGVVTGVDISFAGEGYTTVPTVMISPPSDGCTGNLNISGCIDGHVDPRAIMDVGVMNGNIPAPLMAIDEDDEYFLTLTNVGMIMRPDLFEQHTVHFHGYPNASSFYDGVPDASVAINIGASFTYYYLAPDAGTYFWHCHITPPEHLQMGMVGQIFVRPRQDRVPTGTSLYAALQTQQSDLRTACKSDTDILCTNPPPIGGDNGSKCGYDSSSGTMTQKFAYNVATDRPDTTWSTRSRSMASIPTSISSA